MVTINSYKKENAASMAKAKSGYKFCENGLWGVKSADGVVLIAAKYDQIEICSDYVYAHYGKRRTYFYYNGATSDSPDWDDDYRFYQNGKIGFLNKDGSIFLPPIYDEIDDWGEDCDVIYTRQGEDFHYYNRKKEEILTKVNPIPEDAYPLCPYSLGEDQNREVLVCVEPADMQNGDDCCFAYNQWVRLSLIPRKDIRTIFSSCEIVPMPDSALRKFYDKDTYIYSARYCKASGKNPIMKCIKAIESLEAYESTWNFLVRISVNHNTAINLRDLYATVKYFEDLEYVCNEYDISIGYDDTLADGEFSVFQVHYFWDDGGAFLYNRVYQYILPEGSFTDVVEAVNGSEEREALLDKVYWWIEYSENRKWKETKRILDWLYAQGAINVRVALECAIEKMYLMSNYKEEFDFRRKIIKWAIKHGANVNYIKENKTMLDAVRSSIDEKRDSRDSDDINFVKHANKFVEFLSKIGCRTAKEERASMRRRLSKMTPVELLRFSRYSNRIGKYV